MISGDARVKRLALVNSAQSHACSPLVGKERHLHVSDARNHMVGKSISSALLTRMKSERRRCHAI
jgi:hypothetical protein